MGLQRWLWIEFVLANPNSALSRMLLDVAESHKAFVEIQNGKKIAGP